MKRRSFIQASVATVCTAAAATAADEARNKARELYELRTYTLKPSKQPILDTYLSKAFIPTAKRLGIGPVGVFVDKSDETLKYHVLIVHPSAESFTTLSTRLAA